MAIGNTSHAVMSHRHEPKDSVDDFPTPPWATHALINKVFSSEEMKEFSCLEPACGRGFISRVLEVYFKSVICTDKYSYGYAPVRDFLASPYETHSFDWVITNPPFRLSEEFIVQALRVSKIGVCIFARTVFLEGQKRYTNIFRNTPPTSVNQFVERVPLVKGRVDPKASTATSYAWFVWDKRKKQQTTEINWIPPCRKEFSTGHLDKVI